MKIETLVVGQLATNCYLLSDPRTKEAIIIDPGDDGDYIASKIQGWGLKPKLILATHGHFDHLLAVTALKLAFKIPFWMHSADSFLLQRIASSVRYWLKIETDPMPTVEKWLQEGDKIKVGKKQLKVIETPGHTPGSVCFYTSGILFSGDTLFANGVGRTDFAYSSEEKLQDSLKKLFQLPLNTKVYPGHGPLTTIKDEYQSRRPSLALSSW